MLYVLHPELNGRLDEIIINGNLEDNNFKFVSDNGLQIIFDANMETQSIKEVMLITKIYRVPIKFKLIYFCRKTWNRFIRLPEIINRLIIKFYK